MNDTKKQKNQDYLSEKYKTYSVKYKKSKFIYIGINLTIIIMTVILSVLNVRAIQANSENSISWIFFGITFIGLILGLITGLATFLSLSNRNNVSKDQIDYLEETVTSIKKDNLSPKTESQVADDLFAKESTGY